MLPWNRIVIIGFAAFVLVLIWLMMKKTRLGMFVRAVTQNRRWRLRRRAHRAGGHAGLRGRLRHRRAGRVALSQIANVGPDMAGLHRRRLHGGGGRRRRQPGRRGGRRWAWASSSKFLEGWAGAVVAKILVLVFIIVFIQKRPQGIFALKGRFADSGGRRCERPSSLTLRSALAAAAGWRWRLRRRGWIVVPVAHLLGAESHPLHVSAYTASLLGKIMCYAMVVAVAMDLIWGYTGIPSLGHGLFFRPRRLRLRMYLMRQIGRDGSYGADLPDFMVFLDWKAAAWYWRQRRFSPVGAVLAGGRCPALVVRVRLFRLPLAHQGRVFLDHHPGADLRRDAAVLPQRDRLRRQQRLHRLQAHLGFYDHLPGMRMTLFGSRRLADRLPGWRWLGPPKCGWRAGRPSATPSRGSCSSATTRWLVQALHLGGVGDAACGWPGALYVPQVGIINPPKCRRRTPDRDRHLGRVGGRTARWMGPIIGAFHRQPGQELVQLPSASREYWLFCSARCSSSSPVPAPTAWSACGKLKDVVAACMRRSATDTAKGANA